MKITPFLVFLGESTFGQGCDIEKSHQCLKIPKEEGLVCSTCTDGRMEFGWNSMPTARCRCGAIYLYDDEWERVV